MGEKPRSDALKPPVWGARQGRPSWGPNQQPEATAGSGPPQPPFGECCAPSPRQNEKSPSCEGLEMEPADGLEPTTC